MGGSKLRSTGTKAGARVGRAREPRTELEEKLKARARELENELHASNRELNKARQQLAESLEQQTATSEVLRVISSSPGDLETVFKSMLENATRLCDATFGNIYLSDHGDLKLAAMHNTPPALVDYRKGR